MTFFTYLSYFSNFVAKIRLLEMKTGQSVIVLTQKDTGEMHIFGSLAAIYSIFDTDILGISYPSLRNAVSKYIKDNKVDDSGSGAVIIYDTPKSTFTLHRGLMVLSEKS